MGAGGTADPAAPLCRGSVRAPPVPHVCSGTSETRCPGEEGAVGGTRRWFSNLEVSACSSERTCLPTGTQMKFIHQAKWAPTH